MKAILMSIQSPHTCNILNLIKLWEIRKRFPSDYVGWVYIYCTKEKPYLYRVDDDNHFEITNKIKPHTEDYVKDYNANNGKVVARFWCDKVEKIHSYLEPEQWYMTSDLGGSGLLEKSCLSFKELDDYLLSGEGCAIHITKLEIFDKPKEIGEFYTTRLDQDITKRFDNSIQLENGTWVKPLTRAPQSYCFIEVDL